ncbi:MAG: aminotransferase class V-fold PLP-dependent enzyme [Micavibrio aeruginosavorus]|nr:aminotransferase class V-fold PLP-dependent enzyme [Micavibrio aeruginosavorus]
MKNYKDLFSKSLASNPLHFAAHSHHLWPDASESAQARYWQDSAKLADLKWEKIFSEAIPAAQTHIAWHLRLPDAASIAFAPNTHELVSRILSALPDRPSILTTDSEFYSFTRQIARLEEDDLVAVTRIPAQPFGDFPQRFAAEAARGEYELVFFSHVFFNSGYAVPDLGAIVRAVPDEETFIVIDGYHGFMALPTDLSAIAARAFYIAGGYKYAMAGEGCCFLHCPPGYGPRPRNTGWFAAIESLENMDGASVPYAASGTRFQGATFDPSGLYRLNAVMDMVQAQGLTVDSIHLHVMDLQDYFMAELPAAPGRLVTPIANRTRGHFLTYDRDDAGEICKTLLKRGVVTDHRGTRLRFGFGIYHDRDDVGRLIAALDF